MHLAIETTISPIQSDEAIEAYPDLGAIRQVNKLDHSRSSEQTKVQFSHNLQVITYQPSKPVKDLKHTGATFGRAGTPIWGEIKIKAPSKVNACREKLRNVLVQKAQENMAEIDLRRENIRREQSHDPETGLIIKYLMSSWLPKPNPKFSV